MSDLRSADQAARHRIATDLGATLFVEAGAGTGKTTALVTRLVALVTTGAARLAEVAAITFTEAAAAELRDRVLAELEHLLDAQPPPPPEVRARVEQALDEADQAAICTLHSFARRILTSHAVEAGLPPRLQLLDATQSAVAFAQRWDAFLDTLLGDTGPREAVLRARLCGMTVNHLRMLARTYHHNWDLVADHPPAPAGPLAPVRGDELRALAAHALDLASHGPGPDDLLRAYVERYRPYLEDIGATDDGLPLLQLVADAPDLKPGNRGRKADWDGRKDELIETLRAVQAEVDRIRLDTLRDALGHLVVELHRLTVDAAAERRRTGVVEFHDLLVFARDLLRSSPAVAAQLRERWTRLLIDEFQDTDPIQAELAFRIAGTPPPGAPADSPWTELQVEPGRLFFVGDPKQAIYRFRRADIELFLRVRGLVTGSGADDTSELVRLTRNFRSVAPVIDTVNGLFDTLIGDGDGTGQPAFDPLQAERQAWPGQPSVHLLGGALDDRIDGVRRDSAHDVATLVARALDQGWPVHDPHAPDGTERPLRRSDVAILVPTSAEVPALRDALDAHRLPYRVETASLVFASPEVAELLAVVRALADPTDPLALVAALRTPLLGCADDDLATFRLAGGRWDLRRVGSAPAGHPVSQAIGRLAELHHASRWSAPATVVDRLVAELGAYRLPLDGPRARDAWRRLRWVSDQARAFAEAGGTDLRGWLAWVDALSAEGARLTEVTLPETDDDAIRILTIHAAKGLEFPFVVVGGLSQQRRRPDSVLVLWDEHGPAIRIGKGRTTPGFDALVEREGQLLAHEWVRLLYVALTRARDHLVLPLHHRAGDACHAASLTTLATELGLPVAGPAADAPRPSRATTAPPPAPPADAALVHLTPAARAEQLAARDAAFARAALGSSISPTELVQQLAPDAAVDRTDDPDLGADTAAPSEPDPGDAPWRRGRGGTALGRAVHGTLQLVDLATHHQLDELATAQAAAEGVRERAPEVARLARHALASPVVAGAASRRTWRELFVAAPVGDRVLEGFVDLLVDTPDGLCVVDYKTALGATDDELAERTRNHTVQGAAYAVALEAVVGRPVERFVLVYLRADGAVEHEVSDLAAAKAQVRAALGAP